MPLRLPSALLFSFDGPVEALTRGGIVGIAGQHLAEDALGVGVVPPLPILLPEAGEPFCIACKCTSRRWRGGRDRVFLDYRGRSAWFRLCRFGRGSGIPGGFAGEAWRRGCFRRAGGQVGRRRGRGGRRLEGSLDRGGRARLRAAGGKHVAYAQPGNEDGAGGDRDSGYQDRARQAKCGGLPLYRACQALFGRGSYGR